MCGYDIRFSGQNGENSGNLSRKAAGVIVDIADSVHLVDVRWNGRQELIDKIELPVRKAAHMTEYAIFACLVYLAFTVDGVSWQLVRFISFLQRQHLHVQMNFINYTFREEMAALQMY